MGFKSPEDAVEEFLARQPSWVQKVLQGNYAFTLEEQSQFKLSNFPEVLGRAEDEYLPLLRKCPAKWREHCRRKEQEALSSVPSIPGGRPRKDALATEAVELQEAGLSYAKVAQKLNLKYGPGTTTPGAVRQLIRSRKQKP